MWLIKFLVHAFFIRKAPYSWDNLTVVLSSGTVCVGALYIALRNCSLTRLQSYYTVLPCLSINVRLYRIHTQRHRSVKGKAVAPLKEALTLMKRRLSALTEAAEADNGKGKVEEDTSNNESAEIEQLIAEVDAKLADLRTQVIAGKDASITSQLKSSLQSAAIGAAQDLSGLVRKRKLEP